METEYRVREKTRSRRRSKMKQKKNGKKKIRVTGSRREIMIKKYTGRRDER
jgi:hypothetical protein